MSNTLLIYNQLRAAGVSRAGALGLLGNWKAESGLEPGRLAVVGRERLDAGELDDAERVPWYEPAVPPRARAE